MDQKNLWQLSVQFVKFGFVGVSNTLISLIVYYACLAIGIHYIVANTLGFIVGTINAYFWNNKYVFKKKAGEFRDTKKSVVRVFISYGFTLVLSTVLLAFWVDGLHISEGIAPILNLLVTIPLNFILNKFWAFREEKKAMKTNMQKKNSTHCFAICAYKDSPYLENCIRSLKAQTVKTGIILATSTPSEYIYELAKKYEIPYYVREGKSDIQDDWNFAFNHAEADYVTIAHQDDEYDPGYAEALLVAASKFQDISLFISDYLPIKNGVVGPRDINSKIRRLLRTPLKISFLANKKWVKKAILCLGNSICCPAVTYHKRILGESVFTSEYKYNLDWDTFYKYACLPGRFAYVDKPLTHYRVHDGATSKEFIEDQRRVADDISMFRKFWPEWFVRLIMVFYKNAYKTYG